MVLEMVARDKELACLGQEDTGLVGKKPFDLKEQLD